VTVWKTPESLVLDHMRLPQCILTGMGVIAAGAIKVLPPGMSFPLDFVFIPSTRGEDGDPLDVLVVMDEPG
jgi:hypothetical protein